MQLRAWSGTAALGGAVRTVDSRVAAVVSSRHTATEGAATVETNRLGAAAVAIDFVFPWDIHAAELREAGIRANGIACPVDALLTMLAAF
jgi:hypothetical protein